MSTEIVDKFDLKKTTFDAMYESCHRLIIDLLKAAKIQVHSVTGRVKGRASLAQKLVRKGQTYQNLEDVTDVIGLRVVTFFEDDVDRVAELIKSEFFLLEEHCVDKRKSLEPDQFGYLSVHFVCKLPDARRMLKENSLFQDEVFEVQIRSILQHAWAEIEHDLGYKTEAAVPAEIKRQLSRVASLLEIADRDFREVRERAAEYQIRVKDEINKNRIDEMLIDLDSYKAFIETSDVEKEFDRWGEEFLGMKIEEDPVPEVTVECLTIVGIRTIQQLQEALAKNKMKLQQIALLKFPPPTRPVGKIAGGLTPFYLTQLLAARQGRSRLYEMFNKCSIGAEEERDNDTDDVMEEMMQVDKSQE